MISDYECNYNIEEVNVLMNDFKIREDHSNEIINIYFEFFNHMSYLDFLKQEIRVFKKEGNEDIIKQLEDYEDTCAFDGGDYILITNYNTVKQAINIEDNLLIDKWFEYTEDKTEYAPLQNLNKLLNYIYYGELHDDEYDDISSYIRNVIKDSIKNSDTNKKTLLTYIKDDEEFLEFIGDNDE